MTTVAKYDIFEQSFTGPSAGNPFLEVEFDAVFSKHSREVRVPGFYDGGETYRVRFMPDSEGEWTSSGALLRAPARRPASPG